MRYEFKAVEEVCWGATAAAVVYILQTVVTSAPSHDWRTWAISLGAGTMRAAAGYALGHMKAPQT